jgi:phosphatidylglycerophosphate synthase
MLEGLKPFYNSVLRPFARAINALGIHPNYITLTGVIFFAAGGCFSAINRWTTGLLLVIAGALFDGLDGLVARESGKKSVFGAILDSSCDRLTEVFLLLGLLIYYANHPVQGNWGIYLCFTGISGSIMVSYVKARCEGVGVPCRRGLLQRPERIILLSFGLLFGPLVMFWILGGLTLLSSVTVVQRLIEAAEQCKKSESKLT